MKQKTRIVNDFWDKFREEVINSGIPENKADWYINWAKKFALYIKGKPLPKRSSKEVQNFLSFLELQDNIAPWQVKQADDALGFLYHDFLKIDLNWQRTARSSRGSRKSERKNQDESAFRDYVVSGAEIKSLYGDIFKKLTTELRVRHYSLRTEPSY